jgi:hypothetical protein
MPFIAKTVWGCSDLLKRQPQSKEKKKNKKEKATR